MPEQDARNVVLPVTDMFTRYMDVSLPLDLGAYEGMAEAYDDSRQYFLEETRVINGKERACTPQLIVNRKSNVRVVYWCELITEGEWRSLAQQCGCRACAMTFGKCMECNTMFGKDCPSCYMCLKHVRGLGLSVRGNSTSPREWCVDPVTIDGARRDVHRPWVLRHCNTFYTGTTGMVVAFIIISYFLRAFYI